MKRELAIAQVAFITETYWPIVFTAITVVMLSKQTKLQHFIGHCLIDGLTVLLRKLLRASSNPKRELITQLTNQNNPVCWLGWIFTGVALENFWVAWASAVPIYIWKAVSPAQHSKKKPRLCLAHSRVRRAAIKTLRAYWRRMRWSNTVKMWKTCVQRNGTRRKIAREERALRFDVLVIVCFSSW